MLGRTTLLPCLLGALAFGCGAGGGVDGDPRSTGTARAPVIAGIADTEHQAVVYISVSGAGQSGACSGTIVQADPVTGIGYVLTAAHCLSNGFGADYVVVGDDASLLADIRYVALGSIVDGHYPIESGYDMGLVRIVGVDETTPTIPIIDAVDDAIATGDSVTAVGYGLTEPDLHAINTVRHRIDMTVMDTPDRELVVSAYGDICSGDSGGPLLTTIAGQERVAGVIDSGDPSCFLLGRASRVRPSFDAKLAPYAAEDVPDSCFRCAAARVSGQGECGDEARACRADAGCTAVRACVNGCNADAACIDACLERPSHARDLFLARAHCACDPCAGICASAPVVCPPLPIFAPASPPPPDVPAPLIAAGATGGCAVSPGRASGGATRRGVEGQECAGVFAALALTAARRKSRRGDGLARG